MSTADDCPDEENLLFSREELAEDIDSILKGDEHSPEALARLLSVEGELKVEDEPVRLVGAAIERNRGKK